MLAFYRVVFIHVYSSSPGHVSKEPERGPEACIKTPILLIKQNTWTSNDFHKLV
jgi:hypothetical protein